LGVLSLLDERSTDPECGEWIRIGLDAASRQRHLIQEILDVFSTERGVSPADDVDDAPDAAAVATEVVVERRAAARRSGVTISVRAPAGPCPVVGDGTRLFRVLTNLADNAIRHSAPGSVVEIVVDREDASVLIAVEDSGPGISLDLLPYLFQKFGHGRGARTGTGLGLYFCRITVERWGGSIGYEPRTGGGARFWLRLPRSRSHAEVRGSRPTAQEHSHGEAPPPR
jgi:signal transduction histidine kinase